MKPTQWSCKFFDLIGWVTIFIVDYFNEKQNPSIVIIALPIADPGGGINQIPGECTVSGDVRFIRLLRITQRIFKLLMRLYLYIFLCLFVAD
jgi:hypothetical protein